MDRDGIINEHLPGSYVLQWDELVFCDDLLDAFVPASKLMPLVVVTNQRCVSLGLISSRAMESLMHRMTGALAERGIPIAAWYVCPHGNQESCACRKPLPGLLLTAAEDLGIDLGRSYMIGDSPRDIEAGNAAGCARSFLLNPSQPESVAAAVKEVLGKPFLC